MIGTVGIVASLKKKKCSSPGEPMIALRALRAEGEHPSRVAFSCVPFVRVPTHRRLCTVRTSLNLPMLGSGFLSARACAPSTRQGGACREGGRGGPSSPPPSIKRVGHQAASSSASRVAPHRLTPPPAAPLPPPPPRRARARPRRWRRCVTRRARVHCCNVGPVRAAGTCASHGGPAPPCGFFEGDGGGSGPPPLRSRGAEPPSWGSAAGVVLCVCPTRLEPLPAAQHWCRALTRHA